MQRDVALHTHHEECQFLFRAFNFRIIKEIVKLFFFFSLCLKIQSSPFCASIMVVYGVYYNWGPHRRQLLQRCCRPFASIQSRCALVHVTTIQSRCKHNYVAMETRFLHSWATLPPYFSRCRCKRSPVCIDTVATL